MRMRIFPWLLCIAWLLLLTACAKPASQLASQPFTLTIAHVNDTHSALEPSDMSLILAGQKVKTQLGGFARLKTALDEVRAREKNVLTLHAGDAVQGTLYFNVFQGSVDIDFLNYLGLDAMTLGNHEFDKGPALISMLAAKAQFPLISANLDLSEEPLLAGRIRPFVIKGFGPERVGIVGTTTPTTPNLVANVGGVRFHEATADVDKAVKELRGQGINKIVVLSHNGYDQDIKLARAVPGIDVIVGGHSHTLLGDSDAFAQLGLTPAGPYPTEVTGPDGKKVLVVQAWRWGMQLGELQVSFDNVGDILSQKARPMLLAGGSFSRGETPIVKDTAEYTAIVGALEASGVARVVPENKSVAERLAPYTRQLNQFRSASIGAKAGVDLIRDSATDPGPLVADAFLAKAPTAQLALVMPGNVRRDIFQGEITLGMVMGVLPFGNSLVILDLTGTEMKNALEDAAEFRLKVRPPDGTDLRKFAMFYASGFTCTVDPAKARGERIGTVRVRQPDGSYAAMNLSATYRLVTNSFLANGGDGLATLKNTLGKREDTGFIEHDALIEHLKSLGAVLAPDQKRVIIEDGISIPAQRPISFFWPCHDGLGLAA